AARDIDVKIVTGDRDFFQLVNDSIHVLYNRRGITDIVEMDPKAVEDRYGVPPSKYVDLKALEGDPSDNLPGVPGVGTKTAAKLVQKYGSAEEVLVHADEQTPKLSQNLAAHAEQVKLNKKLATLAEVPLEGIEIDEMHMGTLDVEGRLKELFTSLEFRTLYERLVADLPEVASGEGEAFELEVRVFSTSSSLGDLAAELSAAERFSIDVVALGARSAPRSLAFAYDDKTAYVPVGPDGVSPEEARSKLGAVLVDPTRPKIAHGGRRAIIHLDAIGISLAGLVLDTQVGAYLLDPGASGYALEDVARRYAGRELKAVDGVARDEDASQGTVDLGGSGSEVDAEDA
ncbi:MAG: 5'-3' exonuclease H3TH domain-containing protein, partial [Actinomycetota bacterium]